jgi:hypothetical protein
MPVWLAPIAGKAAWGVLALLGVLLAYWLIRKGARREERLEAALEAKERARRAHEAVARLRGAPGSPFPDELHRDKPLE